MPAELDPKTRDFYLYALGIMNASDVPFLLGGAYALGRYTGIERHTKDLDLFIRPADFERALALFASGGDRVERTHPHWLGKVYHGDCFLDLIFRSGNALCEVDDEWFAHAVREEVLGIPIRLAPPEEIIWTKVFVMERERFDGADVAHLLRARGADLDWTRLLRRIGPHWRVLFSHLILFGYIYPGERAQVPDWVLQDLLRRMQEELGRAPDVDRVCQGTFLSRSQYLIDLERWGYRDARLQPRGPLAPGDVRHWTAAIAVDGSL